MCTRAPVPGYKARQSPRCRLVSGYSSTPLYLIFGSRATGSKARHNNFKLVASEAVVPEIPIPIPTPGTRGTGVPGYHPGTDNVTLTPRPTGFTSVLSGQTCDPRCCAYDL
eukprot:1595262-Rhodomonas_salina.1